MSVTKEDITTALATIAFPNINPFSRLRKMYQDHVESSGFNNKFLIRNSQDAIKPFLDGLEVKYIIIAPELVTVEISIELDEKLTRLGFVSVSSACPQTSQYKKMLKKTNDLFVDRIYHKDYNFELYLVEPQDWDKIMLTKTIVDDLKVRAGAYYKVFMTIYKRLKHIKE